MIGLLRKSNRLLMLNSSYLLMSFMTIFKSVFRVFVKNGIVIYQEI